MAGNSFIRDLKVSERRQQREAQKRMRELERQAKEYAKLSEIEQARLEVATFESGLEVLLSVHREQPKVWDWMALKTSLPPHCPRKYPRNELKEKLLGEFQKGARSYQEIEAGIERARILDEHDYQDAAADYAREAARHVRMKTLAARIIAGEQKAYTEALAEFSALAEISTLGSSIHFTVHSATLVECVLKVNGRQAIPSEIKSLTSTGKMSVKPMPKARFHEIYQDYVCGCLLRVAREVFAVLPIETLLSTASVDIIDSRTGQASDQPVLSVAIPRSAIAGLNFELLDPSDAIENFLHRGNFKTSRISGEFESVRPIMPADLPQPPPENINVFGYLDTIRHLRREIKAESEKLQIQLKETVSAPPPSI